MRCAPPARPPLGAHPPASHLCAQAALGDEYELASEHAHSNIVLIAHRDFKVPPHPAPFARSHPHTQTTGNDENPHHYLLLIRITP